MALELYFTFSVEELKSQMMGGNYSQIRTFEYGYMSSRYEAPASQWVTTWDGGGGATNHGSPTWQKVSESAQLPNGGIGGATAHSPWARFSATCMYFGAELIDAKRRLGVDADVGGVDNVPIGLIQSSIGGTMIEEWMPNATRAKCTNISTHTDTSALYHGMVAPFVNYSVAAWLWYQGENDCGNREMGDPTTNTGYACALPAMIESWRTVWSSANADSEDTRLFGIATLAAGGSEGAGQNMASIECLHASLFVLLDLRWWCPACVLLKCASASTTPLGWVPAPIGR
jgi:hypothetical protein